MPPLCSAVDTLDTYIHDDGNEKEEGGYSANSANDEIVSLRINYHPLLSFTAKVKRDRNARIFRYKPKLISAYV